VNTLAILKNLKNGKEDEKTLTFA